MVRAGGTCGGEDNACKVWWWFLKDRGDGKRSRHGWEYNKCIYCILQFGVTHKENFSVHTR